jgi:hypothetical protein
MMRSSNRVKLDKSTKKSVLADISGTGGFIETLQGEEAASAISDTNAQIAITSGLMGSSLTGQFIETLQGEAAAALGLIETLQDKNAPIPKIEDTVKLLVSKSFRIRVELSETYEGTTKFIYPHKKKCFYRECLTFYNSLEQWQQPLYHLVLQKFNNDSDDYTTCEKMIGLISIANEQCNARRIQTFYILVQNCAPSQDVDLPRNQGLEDSKRVLYDAVREKIDELKDTAFKRTFLEPTKLYFRAVGEDVKEGDVDIHGSNTYLSILKYSSLSIFLSRPPMPGDGLVGIAPFKEALRKKDLKRLWDPSVEGETWEHILKNCEFDVERRVRENTFYVSGENAEAVGLACAHDSGDKFIYIKPYLNAFASFFEKDRMCDVLTKFLFSHDSLKPHLNTIFEAIATKDEVTEAKGEARYWIWDPKKDYTFNKERAYKLLSYVGIVKDSI